jgi:sec-independent protein translocase protein TatA
VIGDILQPTHLLFVLVVALLVLGPKKLPEVGRSLGRGLRDFRNALSGEESHPESITQVSTPPAEYAPPAVAPQQPAQEAGHDAPASTPEEPSAAAGEPHAVEEAPAVGSKPAS